MNRASIFGRTLGPSRAAGVTFVLSLPAAAQLLATDPLLLLSAPVDPGQRLALSLPGVPFASDWSDLLGPALRGSPDGRGGDQLVFWIAPEQRGSGATATATIAGGKVDRINIVNKGSGYLPPVSVTISGGGATANASAEPVVVLWEDKTNDLPLLGIWQGRTYFPLPGVLVPEAWLPSQHLVINSQNAQYNEMNE